MGERTDYEYRDKYGWFKKEDVSPIYSEPFLEEFCKWWEENYIKKVFITKEQHYILLTKGRNIMPVGCITMKVSLKMPSKN